MFRRLLLLIALCGVAVAQQPGRGAGRAVESKQPMPSLAKLAARAAESKSGVTAQTSKRQNLVHKHMFNFFRLGGDMLHLVSFVSLLYILLTKRSCAGISVRTQELYLIVFLTRYVDVFWNFLSLYNTTMKVLFIAVTMFVIYLMRFHGEVASTASDESGSGVMIIVMIFVCLILAVAYNEVPLSKSFLCQDMMSTCTITVLWAFSHYLEAVAILPQLRLTFRKKIVANLTSHYIFALGSYRAFYLCNFIYRYFVDPVSSRAFVVKCATAIVQTVLYIRFFVMYFRSKAMHGLHTNVELADASHFV
jgi:ER lumen protein retaining receptor